MKFRILHIASIIGFILIMTLSSCSKKCQVNGCRVRMEHSHSGKKFKSKIRRWYTFQNPRVGRDYKRDISPDKIPWDGPDLESGAEQDMLVSNDTSSFGDGGFMGDEFYEGDSVGGNNFAPIEEDQGKKKRKRRKRKGEEEEEVKKEPAGDPWDIEHIEEEDPVIRKPVVKETKEETLEEGSATEDKGDKEGEEQDDKKDKKKSKKEIAEERKKQREELLKKQLEEEEEEDDDWGF